MNIRIIACGAFGLALAATIATAGAAPLRAQARISEADARATALQRVPDGSVASAELETEHGRLIWSFDITRPATRNITEIQVDAHSGAVVSMQVETAADQAREKAADARPHPHR